MSTTPSSPFGPAIDVRDMFAAERRRLLDVLRDLDPADWSLPTPCPGWSVGDIAAHVLGDDLGRLARTRDGHAGLAPVDGEPFPQFIDRINEEWVLAARRLSPELLRAALAWTGDQVTALWRSLPHEDLGEAVSWAGPEPAPVWLDAARDFTEYWVHRHQIREALGMTAPEDPATARTVIDTFMRALPHTLRNQQRPAGDAFSFVVPGAAGGTWTVVRGADRWAFVDARPDAANAVVLDAESTWRLCVRMIEPREARQRAEVRGDTRLADTALGILSIIRSS